MDDLEGKSKALQEAPDELHESYSNDKPGYAAIVIFTNYKQSPRTNALENVRPLIDILPKFGFAIKTIAIDKSTKQTENLFGTLRKADLSEYSSLLLIVSSHGDQNGIIHPKSNSWHFKYSNVQEDIDANASLRGKPKWIIFSCCNGNKPDLAPPMEQIRYTTAVEGPAGASSGDDSLPKYCDMLITYASVKGYFALRDINDGGTWLLNALTQSLNDVYESAIQKPELPLQFDVMLLIARMGNTVSKFSHPVEFQGQTRQLKQMSETVHRLRKAFHLRILKEPVKVDDEVLQSLTKKLNSLKLAADQSGYGDPSFSNFKGQDEERVNLPVINQNQLSAGDEESGTASFAMNERVPEVADSSKPAAREPATYSRDEVGGEETDDDDDDDDDDESDSS